MFRGLLILVLLGTTVLLISYVPVNSGSNLKVVASLEAFAGIVKAIGGNYVSVDYIVPDGVSPHEYSLTQQDEQKIASADLIVLSNSEFLSLESKIKEKFPGKAYLDFDDYENYGLEILPAPGIEENYHGYWLYPKNALAISKAVTQKLKLLDPVHADVYDSNEVVFQEKIQKFEEKMIEKAKDLGIYGKGGLLAVPGVAYIAYSYGVMPKKSLLKAPGAFAGAGEINDIVEMIKKGEIVVGFCPESLKDTKPGELIRDIQSQVELPVAYVRVFSLGGLNDYIALLAYNYAVVSNLDESRGINDSSSELVLYLTVGLAIIAIIALFEACIIFNYKKVAEEVLYE